MENYKDMDLSLLQFDPFVEAVNAHVHATRDIGLAEAMIKGLLGRFNPAIFGVTFCFHMAPYQNCKRRL